MALDMTLFHSLDIRWLPYYVVILLLSYSLGNRVVENIPNATAVGSAYHGYWPSNLFGSTLFPRPDAAVSSSLTMGL